MPATLTTRILRLALLPPVLALAAQAGAATQQGAFTARITVTSQCNTQQALFGPQAERNVTVICQPGMTPYQTQSIDLGNASVAKKDEGSVPSESASQAAGAASFSPSLKTELSPPLPSAATFASKLIFVVF